MLLWLQVVSGAAQALCALARLSPSAGQRLVALVTEHIRQLKQQQHQLENPTPDAAKQQTIVAYTSRCISSFVMMGSPLPAVELAQYS